ncbi:MAG: ABC transporter permease [Thermodesulfovibrionia bacterium]|nr:ABC transporter permease [Thermodesulfovibrionia bacterium]
MEKHKKILEYAISSLLRRTYRNLAVIVVFSFMVAVLSSVLFLTHSFKVEALNVLSDAPELIVQRTSGGRHDLIPSDYMKKIKGIFGVGEVIPRFWGYYYDRMTDSNYTLMGIDKNMRGLELLDGRMPTDSGECAIGKGVSDVRSAGIGGKMYLINSRGRVIAFKVVGVFTSGSNILTNDLVLLTKDSVKTFFGMPSGMATDIIVEVNNDYEAPFVISKIKELLPDTRPIMKKEIIRTYDTVFSWRSGMVLIMFFGALTAFCILAWDKATGLSDGERQEIGILKAIGWETSDILELKFWEGIVISLMSFLSGLILAYVHVFFFGASVFSPVLKGWSVLFPQFRLMPYISLYQVFILLFFTVVPYVASTIIPSWRAAITEPDSVMRG